MKRNSCHRDADRRRKDILAIVCRAVRVSAQQLAEATKLSRGTIQRAELETAQVTASNTDRIVETLETKGVIFLPSNGEGPGVRLRKQKRK